MVPMKAPAAKARAPALCSPNLRHSTLQSRRRQATAVRAFPSSEGTDDTSASASGGRRAVLQAGGVVLAGCLGGLGLEVAPGPALAAPQSLYDFSAKMYGEDVSLKQFEGKVTVVVNVASECPLQNVNYPSLRALRDTYGRDGFELIGFPCNQFGGQAPGSSDEERAYAFKKFRIEFPCFDKVDVNGPLAHPIYKYLRGQQPQSFPRQGTRPLRAGDIEWNYTKFLVDRNGQAVKRFKPSFDPADFEKDVQLLLRGRDPLPEECILHPGRIVCNPKDLQA